MSDLISRQAAMDAFDTEGNELIVAGKENADAVEKYLKTVMERIEQLPSVEPKRGLWIDDGSELGCQCSQCGKTLDEYINCGTEYMTLTEIPNFCPNCGADMRGEQE